MVLERKPVVHRVLGRTDKAHCWWTDRTGIVRCSPLSAGHRNDSFPDGQLQGKAPHSTRLRKRSGEAATPSPRLCGYDDYMPARLLERLFDWLSTAEVVRFGDLVFDVAGRQRCKLYALELFRGSAPARDAEDSWTHLLSRMSGSSLDVQPCSPLVHNMAGLRPDASMTGLGTETCTRASLKPDSSDIMLACSVPLMLASLLDRVYQWLSPRDSVVSGDLIFALAGRESRKRFALELFGRAYAPSLVLSVGRFEIRKFAKLSWPDSINLLEVASRTPAPLRHYFVSLERGSTRVELISRGRLGTLSEIRALATWLRVRPEIASISVISSAPHLRRVRVCCQALLPAHLKLHFLATPNDGALTQRAWWCERHSRMLVLKEISKLVLYKLLLWTSVPAGP